MHRLPSIPRMLLLAGALGLLLVGVGSGCSGAGDDADDTGGSAGSGGTGSGGGKNSGGTTTGGSGAGASSAGGGTDGGGSFPGGQGGEGGGTNLEFPEPSCAATPAITAGNNYGDYSVFAVRLDLDTPPGDYTFRVRTADEGLAAVYRDGTKIGEFPYDPSASLGIGQERTVVFSGLFELALRSTSAADLSALDETLFDGCHTIFVTEAPLVLEGAEYDAFKVVTLTVDAAAEPGTYTFFAESGNTGEVELRRDGTLVDTLTYSWQTTIGGGATFTFDFPGVVSLTIERTMGTSNLFALAGLLFDGRHELRVE